MTQSVVDALERAGRLEALGVMVRSGELAADAKAFAVFYARGGNRRMRRAAARASRGSRRS